MRQRFGFKTFMNKVEIFSSNVSPVFLVAIAKSPPRSSAEVRRQNQAPAHDPARGNEAAISGTGM